MIGPTEYKNDVKVTFCAIQEYALSLGSSVTSLGPSASFWIA